MSGWVMSCKAMWESELGSTSDFERVAVRQSLDRRSFHKRLCCMELTHMSYRSYHGIRVRRRSPEVMPRPRTFCGVMARQGTDPRAGSRTGADDALRVFRMHVTPRAGALLHGQLRKPGFAPKKKSAGGIRRRPWHAQSLTLRQERCYVAEG